MRYDDARPLIATGDLVAVKRRDGLLSPFTRFFTGSDYTHVGVAVWIAGGLWLAELNGGGNHLVPLSQLADVDFDVYECPVDRVVVADVILRVLRTHIPYGAAALPVIGLLNWLRINVFLHPRKILVCSGFCMRIYEEAGWPERSRIVSPVEVTRMLPWKLQVQANFETNNQGSM